MAAITLEVAKKHLEMWLEAESEVAINQSYTIGGKSFTRANLAEIRKQIEYWSNKVAELENLAKKGQKQGIQDCTERFIGKNSRKGRKYKQNRKIKDCPPLPDFL